MTPVSEGREGTVAALLLARAEDDHEALRFEGRSWTWREVVHESRRRADALLARKGDGPFHVGVLLENVPEYLFVLGGGALAGAVVVGINPTRRGAELAADIRHTDCQLILTDERRDDLGREDLGVAPERLLDVTDTTWLDAAPGTIRTDQPGPDDLFLLLFTSGSTGAPKAVRCSQGRLAAAMPGFTSDDVLYSPMPLFHGNALISNWIPALHAGATIVLKRRFSATAFLDDIRAHDVTFVNTVGRALAYVLATPPTAHDRDHRLRFVLAPESSVRDVAAFEARFGCIVIDGYGSSEGGFKLAPRRDSPRGSLGRALGGADVAVVDPATLVECPRAIFGAGGELVNADTATGELVRRDAGSAFEGYYRNEEAEAARTRHGWFWSGDLAYRDEAGDFWFAGRTADWIRVDGENFAAAPVERILGRFGPIAGVAVYGVPDVRTGDQVMAALELRPGASFDPEAFQAFLDAQPDLGTKWAPTFVRIVDALPVTATNKIDKQPLRNERWNGGAIWWRPDRQADWAPMSGSDQVALDAEVVEHGRAALVRPRPVPPDL